MELLLGNLDFQLNASYQEDSEFLRDFARWVVTGRRNENVRQKGIKFGERLMQTYSFFILLPELPFCSQPYGDHKLAFSALQREQHVCLGEKINFQIHASTHKQWPYFSLGPATLHLSTHVVE